ncbi:MAG: hypothetical protein R3F56_06350 [Planctomycetota bacterium]
MIVLLWWCLALAGVLAAAPAGLTDERSVDREADRGAARVDMARRGHPPPTVYLEVDILPGAVQVDVVGELQVWNAWLKLDVSGEYLLSDEDLARIKAGAGTFFDEQNRFAFDGTRQAVRVAEVIPPTDFVPGRNIPNVRVRLRLPYDDEPRTLGILWQEFEATDLFERKAVPVMVRYRGDVEQGVMTPAEPEYLWHTRTVLRRPPQVDAVTSAPAIGWRVSLPAVLVLMCGAGLAFVSGRRRWPVGARVVLGACVLAAAAGAWPYGRVRVPGTGIAVPDTESALSIFQRLHANVYRAFEADTAEHIYDLLAVSVAPSLLDRTYADVYESLVLRGQGGAVCTIEKIEILEQEMQPSPPRVDGRPAFAVVCAWRVHGLVSHWGHEHRRLNQYRARYTIAHDGRAWRIEAVDVTEQSRVDDGG